MKVIVKDLGHKYSGFYQNARRIPGEELTLDNPKDFRPSWMEKVDSEEPKPKSKPGPKPKDEAETAESE